MELTETHPPLLRTVTPEQAAMIGINVGSEIKLTDEQITRFSALHLRSREASVKNEELQNLMVGLSEIRMALNWPSPDENGPIQDGKQAVKAMFDDTNAMRLQTRYINILDKYLTAMEVEVPKA